MATIASAACGSWIAWISAWAWLALILPLVGEPAAKLFDSIRPIRLRDLRFFLLLQQLDLLRRDVLAIEQHETARRHHVVAIHPLAVLLMKAQGGAGIRMVRIQLEDPIEMLAAFVAKFVFAAPLRQLPMSVDGIRRRAGQLLIFGNGIRDRIDLGDLGSRDRHAAAGREFDRAIQLAGIVGRQQFAFEVSAAG